MEKLYSLIQKYSGLSEAEYWCLMAVREGKCQYQYEISNQMFMNKQTVNSALKQLVKKGIIKLVIPENNQRIRLIVLTEEGDAFSRKYLDITQEIERKAWAALMPEEQQVLVSSLKRMNQLLWQEIESRFKTE